MKIVNEEIIKIKSLMNLLVEDTVNPQNWSVGDFYVRRFNKSELNFDALITKVVDKNIDDLTISSIEFNEELKIRSEESKETLSVREIWSSVDGVLWEESSQQKWDDVSKYSIPEQSSNNDDNEEDEEDDEENITNNTSQETTTQTNTQTTTQTDNTTTTTEEPQKENCEGDCNNGKGILTLENGTKYDGKFLNGKFDGRGVYYDATNDVQISGIFSQGELKGNGTIFFEDGTRYMGYITSENSLSKVNIKTLDNKEIPDVINYHFKKINKPATKKVEFNFTGEVYYLNDLKTKIPIVNANIICKKIEDNKEVSNIATNTDKDGKFSIKLERGIYDFEVVSSNGYFVSQKVDDHKFYNNLDKNFILVKNKKYKDPNGGKPDDLVSIGVMTIFDSVKKVENKLYKKSDTKEEYCKRFTEFYYKIVIEHNDLFEENPINQNNLNTSKNFIISCYNQFSTNYDTKLKEKVKTLTNLAGDIEIFEL